MLIGSYVSSTIHTINKRSSHRYQEELMSESMNKKASSNNYDASYKTLDGDDMYVWEGSIVDVDLDGR